MTLKTEINRQKRRLIAKVQRGGLYENFGQNTVSKLQDKYINISSYTDEMNKQRDLIQSFDNWCMNFDLSQIH